MHAIVLTLVAVNDTTSEADSAGGGWSECGDKQRWLLARPFDATSPTHDEAKAMGVKAVIDLGDPETEYGVSETVDEIASLLDARTLG